VNPGAAAGSRTTARLQAIKKKIGNRLQFAPIRIPRIRPKWTLSLIVVQRRPRKPEAVPVTFAR
jgi:hypothetical protein